MPALPKLNNCWPHASCIQEVTLDLLKNQNLEHDMTAIYGTIVEETMYKGVVEFDATITKCYPAATPPSNARVFPDNHLIFPGFIDIHTHCREDVSGKEMHKECYLTAGMAALNGGVTYMADMPNNHVAPVDVDTYDAKQKLASQCPVDVLLYAGIGPKTLPLPKRVPYKAFMGPSIGNLFFEDNKSLDIALSRYVNKPVSFHCECPTMMEQLKNEPKHELRRPPMCEIKAVGFALELINRHKLQGKICHVSTAESMALINASRSIGTDVYAEVTPHHLFFHLDMITSENRHFLQMNPPLRTKADNEALLRSLNNGELDYLASDHAPHTVSEKMSGISGVPQLDTYGGFVSWLIMAKNVSPIQMFKIACLSPGRWIGQFNDRKVGRILPGYEASITVLNMEKSVADNRGIQTRCGWSPFDLRTLPGSVETVYLKGEKVVDGEYMKNF